MILAQKSIFERNKILYNKSNGTCNRHSQFIIWSRLEIVALIIIIIILILILILILIMIIINLL